MQITELINKIKNNTNKLNQLLLNKQANAFAINSLCGQIIDNCDTLCDYSQSREQTKTIIRAMQTANAISHKLAF